MIRFLHCLLLAPLTLQAADLPLWQRSPAQIRETVSVVRGGEDLTPATIAIIEDLGFLYDSSMMADDRPYRLRSAGRETRLVELPVEWILDDWPYFQLDRESGHVGLRSADDVFTI